MGKNLGPLEGVRILDLTRATAGPCGSMILADLGAEVIKVETPETVGGVSSREEEDIGFVTFNRNKKSIVLDLKLSKGKEVIYDLVKKSDVVFDNYRPDVPERLGIDYDTLKNINPRIISCSLTGFGSTGPYRGRPAFDIVIQGLDGVMGLGGMEDPSGRPYWPRAAYADQVGGIWAACGIIAALYAREQSGKGQKIDISLLDGQVALLSFLATYMLNLSILRGPMPSWGAFRTKNDKYITVAATRDRYWRNLCRALGHPEWVQDHRFSPTAKRWENAKELFSLIEEIISTKNAEDWLQVLTKEDVPCSPVNTLSDALSDPQVLHRQMVVTINHPKLGEVKVVGNPLKMSGVNQRYEPSPSYGEHTEEILSQLLGYSRERIDKLKKERVV